ncbi:MAG: D-glycerate dehydrogenase [Acidimicrobiia bacterium]|nr:D-glycerate dehydrogenase [Acidimicrobiia bacterium]
MLPVLLTARLPASVMRRFDGVCDVDAFAGPDEMPYDELLRRVAGKAALVSLIMDRVDDAVLAAGTGLRVVANVGVGYNNIDVTAARARGVIVTNTPDVLTDATADLTWALVLTVTRRVAEGDRLVRRGGWQRWALDFMLGTELRGKQLGIVGFGRIGQAVADRARAFGMRIAFTSRTPRPEEHGERMRLDELLATSDVVSLHAPLTKDTERMIGQPQFARMKRSAYFINTSRGALVDEASLVWALKEGLIAGAGLDVFEREPSVHPGLLELENVVLTPHVGSATVETRTAMADLAVRNVLAVLSGEPALTPVP